MKSEDPSVQMKDMTLTTHLHIVPRLRICGAVPQLPPPPYVFMVWCLVKHTAQTPSLYLYLYLTTFIGKTEADVIKTLSGTSFASWQKLSYCACQVKDRIKQWDICIVWILMGR